jgi:hypothetical protein
MDAIELIVENGGALGCGYENGTRRRLNRPGNEWRSRRGSCLGPREELVDQLIVVSIERIDKRNVL